CTMKEKMGGLCTMKRKRINVSLLALIVFSLLLVTACGGNSGSSTGNNQSGNNSGASLSTDNATKSQDQQDSKQKVTITHVVNGDSPSRDAWIRAIGDAVGVNVDIQVLHNDQFEPILKVRAQNKDLPDLINYHPGARTKTDLL